MSLSPTTMWLVIAASGVLTFALRAAFVLAPRSGDDEDGDPTDHLPAWLQAIAPAALGALVLPALIRPEGAWTPFGPEAIAGTVAALVAWRTRSTVWTIAAGFACLVALELT